MKGETKNETNNIQKGKERNNQRDRRTLTKEQRTGGKRKWRPRRKVGMERGVEREERSREVLIRTVIGNIGIGIGSQDGERKRKEAETLELDGG